VIWFRVHIELDRQFRQRFIAADRDKRQFRLEVCRVVSARSSRHFFAPVSRGMMMPHSGSDSTYPTVQISVTTSVSGCLILVINTLCNIATKSHVSEVSF
jgi:hypothetical protein